MANKNDKSHKSLEAAAEAGDAQAMYDLGLILEERGDLQESGKWMSRASGAGLARATFHVARFLFENDREALSEEWFEKAIQQGSQEALAYEKQTYDELSQDQKKVLRLFASELSDVVTTYGISGSSVEADDLKEDDLHNNRVWSVVEYFASGSTNQDGVEDDAYRTDAMLTPGFEEGAMSYHVARNTYSEARPLESNPHTSLFLVCTACDANGCEDCSGAGELIFSAAWDENGATFWREW